MGENSIKGSLYRKYNTFDIHATTAQERRTTTNKITEFMNLIQQQSRG